MNRDNIYEKINEIFQDVFDDCSIIVTPQTVSDDIEDWDSLEHINLIVAIEKEFNIKFTMDEVTSMKDVGQMVGIIMERAQR